MDMTGPIRHVAIVGAGVIGASWATAFLARGLDVVATDPAPGAEANLFRTVAGQWSAMERIGSGARRLTGAAAFHGLAGGGGGAGRVRAGERAGAARASSGSCFAAWTQAAPPGCAARHQLVHHHGERVPRRLHPASRTRRLGPSVQPAASDPAGRGRRRRATDVRAGDRARDGLLSVGRQAPDPAAQGGARPCRQPAAGGAVAGSLPSGRATAWPASRTSTPRSPMGRACAGRCWGRSSTCTCPAAPAASARCSASRFGTPPRGCGAISASSRWTRRSRAASWRA